MKEDAASTLSLECFDTVLLIGCLPCPVMTQAKHQMTAVKVAQIVVLAQKDELLAL